ncbi:hypothetical protein RSAG8_08342, partial [Rhizoctonia solani AG-8 WAC10335]
MIDRAFVYHIRKDVGLLAPSIKVTLHDRSISHPRWTEPTSSPAKSRLWRLDTAKARHDPNITISVYSSNSYGNLCLRDFQSCSLPFEAGFPKPIASAVRLRQEPTRERRGYKYPEESDRTSQLDLPPPLIRSPLNQISPSLVAPLVQSLPRTSCTGHFKWLAIPQSLALRHSACHQRGDPIIHHCYPSMVRLSIDSIN